MDLLMDIAATRKRLRKLRLAIESHVHNRPLVDASEELDDKALNRLHEEKLAVEAELQAMTAQSPAAILQRKCAAFFPTLLQALDARGASAFSELQGLSYFPMDQPTFLALQTFVNGFHTDLKVSEATTEADRVESSALFYKGNLLWSSVETSTMHLLYSFLRLREERGMTMLRDDDKRYFSDADSTPVTEAEPALWMADAYEDTFLPVWSSKLSYAECDAVSQSEDGHPHMRKTSRSLHKQHPVSLSAFLSEAPPVSGGSASTPRAAAADSSPFGSPSHSPAASSRFGGPRSNGASPASSKNAMKARASSISFRNAGLLLKNGCFSKLLHPTRELQSERGWGETTAVWSPRVFPVADPSSGPLSAGAMPASHRVAVWHEADLTMIIFLRIKEMGPASADTGPEGLNAATLERLEHYIDGQQRFQNLAQLVLARYNTTFAPEKKYVRS
jgi:hypothetical protein